MYIFTHRALWEHFSGQRNLYTGKPSASYAASLEEDKRKEAGRKTKISLTKGSGQSNTNTQE